MKLKTNALLTPGPPEHFMARPTKTTKIILAIGSTCFVVMGISAVVAKNSNAAWLVLFVFGTFVALTLSDYTKTEDINHKRFRLFARANGFRLYDGLDIVELPPFEVNLVDGNSQAFNFYLTGKLHEHDFTMYVGNFLWGNSFQQEIWVFHTKVRAKLPTFAVDSRYNSIKLSHAGYQKIALEGDFSNYFHLYVHKGEEVDVLSVISPDVMETLKAFWQYTDVIVQGHDIWLLGTNEADMDVNARHLFESANAILPELQHRANSYQVNTV